MKLRVPIFLFASLLPLAAQTPQVFSSGSDGSDGDLIYTAPTDGSTLTVVFDPNDKTQFPNGVDKNHNNVFNFKTITIPANVHVVMRADKLGGPVYFLAQNDVTVGGWLDLDGNPGAGGGTVAETFALPGPGGFYGGGGGDNASRPPTAGFGPLGGSASNSKNTCSWAAGGGYTGNQYLVPLVGGSGGGGYAYSFPSIGPGGSAGGGAILIASSGKISIPASGSITAHGGNVDSGSNGAGYGAGGAIRLVANRIEGSGSLLIGAFTNGNCGNVASGQGGIVRLEAFQQTFGGHIDGTFYSASPFATFAPTAASPSVTVVSVGGVPVNQNPTGSFQLPDVTINSAAAVPIVIRASNVPVGTVIHMQVFSENGASQPIDFPALTGSGPTLQTTQTVQFPTGFSRGFVQATFTITN
jgi:hypothetical protein